jgi:signal transduction histidine kinase
VPRLPPLRLNSLPAKLLGLFVLVLMGTGGIAFGIGLRAAERGVESAIQEHSLKLADETTWALRKATSEDAISEALAAAIRSYRGTVLRVELAQGAALGVDADFHVAVSKADGIYLDRYRGPTQWKQRRPPPVTALVPGQGRALLITQPFTDGRGQRAQLTLTTSLQEAERITQTERSVLLKVALAAALFLSLALWLVVDRILMARVRTLEAAMRAVEQGSLSAEAPAPKSGGDELVYLARGFNRMLAQIRGFNAELQRKIEDATAELTRKNRTLEELNELLVAARRDLTAKERLAALGQLTGTIAHELGNPLNAISGHVQLLGRRSDLSDASKAQVQIVSGEVQRMAQVIRRFLDQTRGFTPAKEEVRLTPLVDEALDLTLGQESRTRISIAREVEPAVERVRTDPGLLRHLLTNLIGNAVDAMPAGGRLEVRARLEGGELVLSVADTGSGMSPEVRRHIFEPFYTTKPSDKGTGLGLSICKEIVRAFRGRIDVESEPGRGTTFTMRLPAELVPEAAA